jgi:hypothetical protein
MLLAPRAAVTFSHQQKGLAVTGVSSLQGCGNGKTETKQLGTPFGFELSPPAQDPDSSSAFASCRSGVSKPSVNQS